MRTGMGVEGGGKTGCCGCEAAIAGEGRMTGRGGPRLQETQRRRGKGQ